MCILFLIANANPASDGYKLILASNRDEYFVRPALAAAPWKENPFVFGGRDMEPGCEGGTWLAISAKDKIFKFGALLNILGESHDEDATKRGNLVSDFVSDTKTSQEYLSELVNNGKKYNGYNLVTIEMRDQDVNVHHCSNFGETLREWSIGQALGFGNSPPETPLGKVTYGRQKFDEIVKKQLPKDELVNELMALLQDETKIWPEVQLQRRMPQWARHLSSVCVTQIGNEYGNRTRTVILVDAQNNVDFIEETLMSGDGSGERKKTHLTTKF